MPSSRNKTWQKNAPADQPPRIEGKKVEKLFPKKNIPVLFAENRRRARRQTCQQKPRDPHSSRSSGKGWKACPPVRLFPARAELPTPERSVSKNMIVENQNVPARNITRYYK